MYLESKQLESSLKKFAEMMNAWDSDLASYESWIEKEREAGKNVSGAETNLLKGNRRYTISMDTIESAISYIRVLERELQSGDLARVTRERNELKRYIEKAEKLLRFPLYQMFPKNER